MPKKKVEAAPNPAAGRMKKEATPIQSTQTTGGVKKFNKLQKPATQGATTGGVGQMKRQATPLTPAQRSSGGAGGRVSGTQRTRDPFLAGFNSDLDGTRERPTGGRRRK